MILCAIDDLLFSIKIKTAARHLGAEVYFERQPGAVVQRIREQRPTLIILDLNSTLLAPMDVVAELKADADLRAIPTLGFVAHVDTGTIDAARQAGIDRVMARSAFAQNLGTILTDG
jgi:CheY-like chemotaxis protein